MIGGMNFASITEKNHDVMVAARGPVVREVQKVFDRNWELAGGTTLSPSLEKQNAGYPPADPGEGVWIQYLVTMPYLENTRAFLLSKIKNARKRILLEMYLLSDPALITGLIGAFKRGIDVRVLLDANRLPLEFDLGGFPNKAAIQKLLRENIPVRLYRCAPGQEMHMKVALFDDDEVVVGSTNWTYASFAANSESCFFMKGKSVFEKFRALFEEDWTRNSLPAAPLNFKEKIIAAGFNRVYKEY
ncbi:MAG: DUF1669 domain-containing protein, partial [Calditrichaeota bacterium]|nr:DUF1669 domain-containing protein [Calditrichota bacterium]